MRLKNIVVALAFLISSVLAVWAFNRTERTKVDNQVVELSADIDHSISLSEAAQLTRNYRNAANNEDVRAGLFARHAIDKILAQDNCEGIRIYLGQSDEGKTQFILIGTDAQGNDMTNGLLAEKSAPCPPICGLENELSSNLQLAEK